MRGDCEHVRESISARLDHEQPPIGDADVDTHLRSCAACARFAEHAQATVGSVRRRQAEPVPDLTARVVTAARHDRSQAHDRRLAYLRVAVAVLGVVQLLLAVPVLTGLTMPEVHAIRHLGALQAGVGAGLLLAAWQPIRATGLLPVMVVAATATVISAAVEVATGHVHLTHELVHLAEVAAVVALWQLARRAARNHPTPSTIS